MQIQDERNSFDTQECAGCGMTAPGATAEIWCPDCACTHPFCAQCAHDAMEALAA